MTAYKKGAIWLANLNPQRKNEVGKVRPVLLMQNDELAEDGYPTMLVLPLTTDLIDDAEPLRIRIKAREKLQKDSDVLVAQMRAVDISRLIEPLAVLGGDELNRIETALLRVLDIE